MKKLKLKGLNYELTKVNKGEKEIYYNEETNNSIILDPIDEGCNVFSIRKGIANDAYQYLIDCLNTNNNLLVHWSQVQQTTSDYTIYHETDSKKLPVALFSIEEILDKAVKGDRVFGYKYTEVKNGEEVKINFNRNNAKRNVGTLTKDNFIDHINCQTMDNRIDNLRLI